MEVSRKSWIIGEGNRTLWSLVGQSSWYKGILIASSNISSSVLSKVYISSFFWCRMYDVLVYKMLWDWKKILNINLWRIIRLSMRPATDMCPHISLHIISLERVYCIAQILVIFR